MKSLKNFIRCATLYLSLAGCNEHINVLAEYEGDITDNQKEYNESCYRSEATIIQKYLNELIHSVKQSDQWFEMPNSYNFSGTEASGTINFQNTENHNSWVNLNIIIHVSNREYLVNLRTKGQFITKTLATYIDDNGEYIHYEGVNFNSMLIKDDQEQIICELNNVIHITNLESYYTLNSR